MDKALITGASSGLGLELAKRLALQKFSLIITGRNQNSLEKIEEELSHITEVKAIACDLTDAKQLKTLCEMIRSERPSLVINNAGAGLYGDIFIHPTDEQIDVLRINVEALTTITIDAAKALKESGKKGVIMNISSAAGQLIYPSFSLYSASKAYVTHMSRCLDAELKGHGIRVLVCCPGQIKTPFRSRASKGVDIETKDSKTMPVEKAACLILDQIKKIKPFAIIDLRYKVLIFLATYLVPQKILQKALRREIQKRI